MKRTITKNVFGFLIIASFALTITGCQKEYNTSLENNLSATQPGANSNAEPLVSVSCGTIPDSLQPPAGSKLALQVYASGVQIYQVKRSPTDPNSYSWVNIAPSANLYARPDFTSQVGTHYAGPSWEFSKGVYKGQKVVATKVKGSNVNPTAVPWLLLKKVDSLSSPNIKVTYIQRVCTTGGLAPTTGADEAHLGNLDSIPYTAVYLFYEKKN